MRIDCVLAAHKLSLVVSLGASAAARTSCRHRVHPQGPCCWSQRSQLHTQRTGSARCAALVSKSWLHSMPQEYQQDVARIAETAERAVDNWQTLLTDFYAPPVVAEALRVLEPIADAERCRLAVGRQDLLAGMVEQPEQVGGVAVLLVKGQFMFDPAKHGDFLGACLGTGIQRSKVGDILVQGEAGAHIMVVPELVPFLETSLQSVRSVTVSTKEVSPSALQVPEARVQELRSVEASLRLDAVASAGFRTSRSKITDMCKSGDCRLNWREAKASAPVAEGDMISCAGKGRVQVKEIGETKKGKFAVSMVRYL